ncbi:hypothetical protein EBU71_22350, partial [bacterium]|nr:hypothetical protein [Candidatus Elulimicrobium humile]
ALLNLYRQLPIIRNSVYPWINYDYNYSNYIDNNYSAQATGSSTSGSNMLKNVTLFLTYIEAYLTTANPNSKTIPGSIDKNSDYPIYGCTGINSNACKATRSLQTIKQLPPYSDPFFDKNLSGENSSSYYIRVGTCPRPDISNETDCIKKEYEYVGKKCYQPRYAYISNTPGLQIKGKTFGLNGLLPSITNDLLSFTPNKLIDVYEGRDVEGYFELQPCPKISDIKEGFSQDKLSLSNYIISIVSITLIITFLSYVMFNKI